MPLISLGDMQFETTYFEEQILVDILEFNVFQN